MIPRARRADPAVTLLEVSTAILIIAILAVIAFPVYGKILARAQRLQCMTNLRALSVSAEQYIQQNGMWPQINPVGIDDAAAQEFAQTWLETLRPYGATEKTWLCPTVQAGLGNPNVLEPTNNRIDYYPMPFDDKPTRPHQWQHQPWFIETADSHGSGPLIIFTDGSISDLKTLIASSKPAAK